MKRLFCIFTGCVLLTVGACTKYKSPSHETWPQYLHGASFMDMTENAKTAKKPIFQGAGGHLVSDVMKPPSEYGDKNANDTAMYLQYMSELEFKLYDALRKPGTSVQRAGTDIVVLLVRDAIMELNAPEVSKEGDENLNTIAKILKQYDATFIEIAGYTDSMRDTRAAQALSLDMAQRVAVYLVQHGIKTSRIFIVGRGAARPIAGQDEMGRLTNRRVELRITPVR